MKRIQNIQALRGVAVLLVVLFHMMIVERRYGGADSLLPEALLFGNFGVDLFFVISGFVMVMVTRGKFQNLRQSLSFLYHRASRIYPLYWVYTCVALGVFLILPGWVNSSQGGQVDVTASFLLLPSNVLPLVQVGWSLIHEMYFYIVFFFIFLLFPERMLPAALLVWGAVVIVFKQLALFVNPYYHLIFNPLTIEFLAGCLLALLYFKDKPSPIRGVWLVTIAVAALGASIVGQVLHADIPHDWQRLLLYGLPAVIIVYCITEAERKGVTLPPALIQTGDASYSIYLSHLFTINAVGRLWAVFAADAAYDNFIMLPVMLAITLFAGFVSYKLIEMPLLKLTRKVA